MKKESKAVKEKYPVNYDFGKNWKTEIVPLLETPEVLKAIRKGVNDYLKRTGGTKKYVKNTPPARYSSGDGYATFMDKKMENLIYQLRQENNLPKAFNKVENELSIFYKSNNTNGDEMERLNDIYFNEYNKLYRKYFCWKNIKHTMEPYVFYGACHWWAPTFCLTLANLVEPDQEWQIRKGEKHTTIINKNKTKVFDLVYWYLLLDDNTLGGKQAFIDSL